MRSCARRSARCSSAPTSARADSRRGGAHAVEGAGHRLDGGAGRVHGLDRARQERVRRASRRKRSSTSGAASDQKNAQGDQEIREGTTNVLVALELLISLLLVPAAARRRFRRMRATTTSGICSGRMSASAAPAARAAHPMAFLVTDGKLVGFDLADGKVAWEQQADVRSRVIVGAGAIAHRQGERDVVVRAAATGAVRATVSVPADETFLGATLDGERLVWVVQTAAQAHPSSAPLTAAAGGCGRARRRARSARRRRAAASWPCRSRIRIWRCSTAPPARSWRGSAPPTRRSPSCGRCPRASTTAARAASIGSTTRARRDRARLDRTPRRSCRASRCAPRITGTAISRRSRRSARSIAIASCGADATRARASATISPSCTAIASSSRSMRQAGKLRWVYAHPRTDVVASEDAGTRHRLRVGRRRRRASSMRPPARCAWSSKTGLRVSRRQLRRRRRGRGARAAQPTDGRGRRQDARADRVGSRRALHRGQGVRRRRARRRAGVAVSAALLKIVRARRRRAVRRRRRRSARARRWSRARIARRCRRCSRRSPTITTSSTTGSRAASTSIARALGALDVKEAAPAARGALADPATPQRALKEIASGAGRSSAATKRERALREFLLEYRADPAFLLDPAPLTAAGEALDARRRRGAAHGRLRRGDKRTLPPVARRCACSLDEATAKEQQESRSTATRQAGSRNAE